VAHKQEEGIKSRSIQVSRRDTNFKAIKRGEIKVGGEIRMVVGKRGARFKHGRKVALGRAKKNKIKHPEKYCKFANCYNKIPCSIHEKLKQGDK